MTSKKSEDKSLVLSQGQYEILKVLHPELVNAVQAAGKLAAQGGC